MDFNWGIIGTGSIAHTFADDLKHIAASPQKIAAVLSRSQEEGNKFSAEFGNPAVFTDVEAFTNSKPDAVYIATPHPFHFETALACLQQGIPVLCEKPITINAAQLQQLIDVSREKNVFLMEGMWIRFLPGIRRVMALKDENRIGRILSVKASMSYRAPMDKESRYFNPDLGGGSLLDLGVYTVFLATLLLGEPQAVKAVASVSEEGIDKACSILLNYGEDQYATLESSLIVQSNHAAEIAGEKGIIRILDPWFEKSPGIEVEVYDENKETIPLEWEGQGFQFEAAEVNHCISNKLTESPLMPHSLSLQVMQIMDEARRQIDVRYKKYE